ncbi:MAG: hypothetical protein AB7F64_07700 [Gammaproteobacteria bacterium]
MKWKTLLYASLLLFVSIQQAFANTTSVKTVFGYNPQLLSKFKVENNQTPDLTSSQKYLLTNPYKLILNNIMKDHGQTIVRYK